MSARDRDAIADLRDEFIRVLRDDAGLREIQATLYASQIIQYLQDTYGSTRLYIPAPVRVLPAMEIARAIAEGAAPGDICDRFSISRATYYRLREQGASTDRSPSLLPVVSRFAKK